MDVSVGGIGVVVGVHVAAVVGVGASVVACVGVWEARGVAVVVGVSDGDDGRSVAVAVAGTRLGVAEGGGSVGTTDGVSVGMI